MKIRQFSGADAEQVITLWERCNLVRPWNDPRMDIERKLSVQPELFLVGEKDGKIVGSVMAGYDGHRGWVYYFAVDPNHQHNGYGSALLAEAERKLMALGCPKVQLQVRPENASVVDFYKQLGYETYESLSTGKKTHQRHLAAVGGYR